MTGLLGWPLVNSPYFKGEKTLACPKCGSTSIVMTIRPGGRGSGPHGRWRMGDPESSDVNACNDCGHTSDGYAHPAPHLLREGLRPAKTPAKRRSRRSRW